MIIALIRHGIAEDGGNSMSDRERQLTEKGVAKLPETLDSLKEMLPKEGPLRLWSSPAARALQTAELLGEGLGAGKPEIFPWIYDGYGELLQMELRMLEQDARVLIVGHQPHLSNWSWRLFDRPVIFRKGGFAIYRVKGALPCRAELLALYRANLS